MVIWKSVLWGRTSLKNNMRFVFLVNSHGYFNFVPAHSVGQYLKRGFVRFMSVRRVDSLRVSPVANCVYSWALRHYDF